MNRTSHITIVAGLLVAILIGCGHQQQRQPETLPESQQAKQLLQGVWMDEETEMLAFRMKGDSVYYADSTSMPAAFKVVGDTLYIGSSASYHIEKHTEHVLWFKNQNGEVVKFVKTDEPAVNSTFVPKKPQVLTLTEVLKRDTVVFLNGDRYHCYTAVNPTKYKVVRHTVNEDGLDVENIYYDNIIHLSVFKGAQQVFSRDFRKQGYQKLVRSDFLEQAVLNDMHFLKADAEGFHFGASLCLPDDAGCYMVDNIVSLRGTVTSKLLEY